MDPWTITVEEQAMYEKQFKMLAPSADVVTGQIARAFMIQSRLPPAILGEIWELSDVDADGKLTMAEFIVACKLINCKLRGTEVPPKLPSALCRFISGNVSGDGTPLATPTKPYDSTSPRGSTAADRAPSVVSPPQSVPGSGSATPDRKSSAGSSTVEKAETLERRTSRPSVPPPLSPEPTSVSKAFDRKPPRPNPPQSVPGSRSSSPDRRSSRPPVPQSMPGSRTGSRSGSPEFRSSRSAAPQSVPGSGASSPIRRPSRPPPPSPRSGSPSPDQAPPIPPTSARPLTTPPRKPSIPTSSQVPQEPSSEKATLQANEEWAIPEAAISKYSTFFESIQADGFVAGVQARNVMVASQLPTATLGHIWSLSDLDSDGKLAREEFILAMYLCELGTRGFKIPPKLPDSFIPPSLRKAKQDIEEIGGDTCRKPNESYRRVSLSGKTNLASAPETTSFSRKESLSRITPDSADQPIRRGSSSGRVDDVRKEIPINQSLLEDEANGNLIENKRIHLIGNDADGSKVIPRKPSLTADLDDKSATPNSARITKKESLSRAADYGTISEIRKSSTTSSVEEGASAVSSRIARRESSTCSIDKESFDPARVIRKESLTRIGSSGSITDPTGMIRKDSRTRFSISDSAGGSSEIIRKKSIPTSTAVEDSGEIDRKDSSKKTDEELRNEAFKDFEEGSDESASENDKNFKREPLSEIQNLEKEIDVEKEKLIEEMKQKQTEFVKQKKLDLVLNRQKEQEAVSRLKTRNVALNEDVKKTTEKFQTLTKSISDTRRDVATVKSTIDGMRSTRDKLMAELNQAKSQIKENNQKLIVITQEKKRMEQKAKQSRAEQEDEEKQISSRKKAIEEKNEQITKLEEQFETKKLKLEEDNESLNTLKGDLLRVLKSCEEIYANYSEKKEKVSELKESKLASLSAWTDEAWDAAPTSWQSDAAVPDATPTITVSSYKKYRALYDFEARNNDELSFKYGDIIMVTTTQDAEPGWFAGELNGKTGWFPEAYVECVEDVDPHHEVFAKRVSNGQEAEIVKDVEPKVDYPGEYCVALHPYESEEPGDLRFNQDDVIHVVKKEGDWWTGVLNGITGIFPSNFVRPYENPASPIVSEIIEDVPRCVSAPPIGETAADDARATTPDYQSGSESGGGTISRMRRAEVATVIAPYQADGPEQLSLQKGQLIVVRKKTSNGWWEGELQVKGKKNKKSGWFPSSYVKVMGTSRMRRRSSSRSLSSDTESSSATERVIALYKYAALNHDELNFEKDDVITVVSKPEPDWWKGDLNGKIGLFPSNYVAPI